MRNAMPKLSIIVPVYKVEKYLRKCIDSILGQMFTDFELILVDDDSPDESPAICEDYKQRDSRIVLVHKENGGLSDARNVGLDIARGQYLGFVDSDDYVAPNMYETLISVMEDSNSDMVICDNYRVSSESITIQNWLGEPRTFDRDEAMYAILTDTIGSQAWNKVYKKDLFAEIRYPKGRLYEDLATTYKYVHRCSKVTYTKVPLYYYTIRGDSISYSSHADRNGHIFLGFKERYEFAKVEYPQFADDCLKLVMEHGLLACYHAILDGDDARFQDIRRYLRQQWGYILGSKRTPTKRKAQAMLLLFSSNLYYALVKCMQAVRRNKQNG
jgi:glycosyltransferase involved in cell wall biosynthesis